MLKMKRIKNSRGTAVPRPVIRIFITDIYPAQSLAFYLPYLRYAETTYPYCPLAV